MQDKPQAPPVEQRPVEYRHVLATGELLADQFRIESVLGAGGFGITYLAQDIGLASTVVVKEYFPSQIAVREATQMVHPRSRTEEGLFDWGRGRFIREAQILDACEHPHIVRVRRVFEANNTAYMALNYIEGPSLDKWLRELGRTPTQAELDAIVAPLLDALEYIHTRPQQILHRDVAPDNIIMHPQRGAILIDFGAARVDSAGRSHSKVGTVKDGYSPKEQHSQRADLQGPWTDIYSTGATLWRAVMGRRPPDCLDRDLDDPMEKLADVGPTLPKSLGYRRAFLAGVDAALAMRPLDRPQSIAQWRILLQQDLERLRPGERSRIVRGPDPAQEAATQLYQPPPAPVPTAEARGNSHRGLILGVLALAAVGGSALAYGKLGKPGGFWGTTKPAQTATVPEPAKPTPASTQPSSTPPGSTPPAATKPADETSAKAASAPAVPPATPAQTGTQTTTQAPAPAPTPPAPPSKAREAAVVDPPPAPQPSPKVDPAEAQQAARECDNLASPPNSGDGVNFEVIDGPAALRHCQTAATAFPKEPRYALQLGRAFAKAGNYGAAVEWYRKAATAGYPLAMAYLGFYYERGLGVPQDYIRAREWYEKAAAAGSGAAHNGLGNLHQNGRGVPINLKKALGSYEAAAALGDRNGEHNLALFYRDGTGVAQDLAKARGLFERAVDKGEIGAMFDLAVLLQRGQGGPQDHPKALALFEKAAGLGNAPAAFRLGNAYAFGQGIARDPAKARTFYERGAALGNVDCEHALGLVYRDGQGVPPDSNKAREWFGRAAQKGHGASWTELGLLAASGRNGQPVDLLQARALYEQAVAKSHPPALHLLAIMLDKGQGGPADPVRAARLLGDAAKAGNVQAGAALFSDMLGWSALTRKALLDELRAAGALTGPATEVWDQATRTAATRFYSPSKSP